MDVTAKEVTAAHVEPLLIEKYNPIVPGPVEAANTANAESFKAL